MREMPPNLRTPDLRNGDLRNGEAARAARLPWLGAWLVAGLYGVYRYQMANPMHTSAHRIGLALGSMLVPMLAAYFIRFVWKERFAPVVAAAVVALLALVTSSAGQEDARSLRAAYLEGFEVRLQSWAKLSASWRESGGCDPVRLQTVAGLDESIRRACELRDTNSEMLAEMQSGDRFYTQCADLGISTKLADDAWGRVQVHPGFADTREILKLTDTGVRAALRCLSSLHSQHGNWTVGEQGELMFEGVSQAVTEAIHVDLLAARTAFEKIQGMAAGRASGG